jgi:(2Fe-2S) ferredoxin
MAIKDLTKVEHILFICNGDTCLGKGSDDTTAQIRKAVTGQQLDDNVRTIRTKCTGQCIHGPMVFAAPDNTWYKGITPELSEELVNRHLVQKEIWREQQLPWDC